jgi:hypothetical protein
LIRLHDNLRAPQDLRQKMNTQSPRRLCGPDKKFDEAARREKSKSRERASQFGGNGGANGRGLAHVEGNPISPDPDDYADFGLAEEHF